MGVKVAKIMLSRFLEEEIEAEILCLTFNYHGMDYKLLNEELKSKYFQDQDKKLVNISHWDDFISQFASEHNEILTDDQKNLLQKSPLDYEYYSIDLKPIFMTIANILNKTNKKVIIMVDELTINVACKVSPKKDRKTSYEVDFLYLSQYENINFILCLCPTIITYGPNPKCDFEMILPEEQLNQLYKILVLRHRNAKMILEYLRLCQEKNTIYDFPSIGDEQILDSESLPPLLEGLEHGVIWIPMKNDFRFGIISQREKEIVVNKLNYIFCQIKEIPSASILYAAFADTELAKFIKENNQDFFGPYSELIFNGKESEVIIYVTSSHLHIQSIARARRLLIVVTCGPNQLWSKIMNEAVNKNLVMKN